MSAMAWLAIVVAGLAVFGLAWCLDRPKPEPQPRTERTLREFLDAARRPDTGHHQSALEINFTLHDGGWETEYIGGDQAIRFVRHREGDV